LFGDEIPGFDHPKGDEIDLLRIQVVIYASNFSDQNARRIDISLGLGF